MSRTRMLLTGASGFVGRAVLREAASFRALEPVAAARRPDALGDIAVPVRVLDLEDREAMHSLLAEVRPDVVINAAACGVRSADVTTDQALSVNVRGAVVLTEAAAASGCRCVVHLGSCSEYGSREGSVAESDGLAPMTLYGSTKAAASLMVQERGRSLGIETLVLRLFNLWGACEPPHRLFPSLLRASRDRRPLALTPGTQLKDYSFVDDVANWILRLATMPGIGSHCPVINLGSGRPEPLRDFATDLARPLGAVDLLHFGARPSRAGEPIMQVPDLARLENLLPDRRITGRAEALERVLAMEDAAA